MSFCRVSPQGAGPPPALYKGLCTRARGQHKAKRCPPAAFGTLRRGGGPHPAPRGRQRRGAPPHRLRPKATQPRTQCPPGPLLLPATESSVGGESPEGKTLLKIKPKPTEESQGGSGRRSARPAAVPARPRPASSPLQPWLRARVQGRKGLQQGARAPVRHPALILVRGSFCVLFPFLF